MDVNEVIVNGEVIVDLKSDTVTPETLAEGATAHDASGRSIVGTGSLGAVRYDKVQSLSNEQKAQAINNIGAVSKTGITLGVHSDGLLYIFVNGSPVGEGIEIGAVGDVIGYVDESNNIVLTGELAEEVYNVKYEKEDGTTVDIGELSLVEVIEIINQIPLSTDTDGTIYNGIGYKTGTRINSSGAAVAAPDVSVTGFIPAKKNDVIYMKDVLNATDNTGYTKIALYGSDKVKLNEAYPNSCTNEGNGIYSYTITTDNTSYIRIGTYKIMDGSEIVTINQPIE